MWTSEIFQKTKYKANLWWSYTKEIFFLGGDWKDKLKMFIIIFINLYKTHNMIKFRAEWSNSTINFLDFVMSINNGVIETVLHVKPANSHQ